MPAMYDVRFHACGQDLRGEWDGRRWGGIPGLQLLQFRAEGSSHRPQTSVKLSYNDEGLSGIFRVEDRYVGCLRTAYQSPVYKDSCVEFFVRPCAGRGYFNFEFNCGGVLLCSYITDATRTAEGFKEFLLLPPEDGRRVRVYASLAQHGPGLVSPEITEPVTWFLEFFIPFGLFEKYTGSLGSLSGQVWSANFFKCGDETSHPHWASWQPLQSLNFHLPDCFGTIRFAERTENAAPKLP